MLSPFAWLRRKAAEAVALGVADGLQALAPDGDADQPPDLASLRALLAKPLAVEVSPAILAPPVTKVRMSK